MSRPASAPSMDPNISPVASEHQRKSVDMPRAEALAGVVTPQQEGEVELKPLRDIGVLSARQLPIKCEPFLCDGMDFFADPNCGANLQAGHAYFYFSTKPTSKMDDEERYVMNEIVNLSCFQNETKENNVPHFNPFSSEDCAKYTMVMTKATYMISHVHLSQLTPQYIANVDYQRSCQPETATIDSAVPDDSTIRFTKQIIKFLYSMTVQLKITRIDPRRLPRLSQLDLIKVDHALLLERTKRNITKVDSTAKAKSVLLYSQVDGGVLVTNITVALNTSIPTVVASVLNGFGSNGAREVSETAERTRKHLTAKATGKK
eukprot:PhM_4_TR15262/c0_g1_i1/m.85343